MIQETNKELLFSSDARNKIKRGVDIVADAVKTTLGPGGQTVIIGTNNGPHITKDGVTVAKSIKLKDNFEDLGAQLCKEIALKTVAEAGDGTTTSLVLAQALINYGLEAIEKGTNPVLLKKEIEDRIKDFIDYVKLKSVPVNSTEVLKNIATISANNDAEIGALIAEAFEKIGVNGVITVEESKDTTTSIDVIQGMQFDRGMVAPHFATDLVKNESVLLNPYILITEQRISNIKHLLPILEPIKEEGRPILFIAEDYENDVLDVFKYNHIQNNLRLCCIKAPSFGQFRKDILHDIAVLTDGESLTYDSNLSLKDVNMGMLGKCEKVVVTKDTCTIIGGKGNQKVIDFRVQQIKNQIATEEAETTVENAKLRLAKLSGGVAVVYVGGTTELEMKERKDRIDDAVCATRAAIEEGVVIGGGQLLCKVGGNNIRDNLRATPGDDVVDYSLRVPFFQILENCGKDKDEQRKIEEEILGLGSYGYDAKTGEFCNLMERGIIDPTKVVRLSLENAASIAGLVLSTNCVIAPEQINVISL